MNAHQGIQLFFNVFKGSIFARMSACIHVAAQKPIYDLKKYYS